MLRAPLPAGATWARSPRPSDAARVTVVIPCHNYGRFLRQAVTSVLAQANVDVDVLIMDDASTDETPAIAGALARADPRVSVVRHEFNRGHVPTFNEGLLELASGEYLVLLSADDMLTPGSLARATAVMETDPSVGLVYGHPRVMLGGTPPAVRIGERGFLRWEGPRWIAAQCRRGLSIIYSPEVCVRASVQRLVGGYNPSLPSTGDLELWMRIATVSRIARINCDQAYRRVHDGSMMNTTYHGLHRDLIGRAKAYDSFFAGAGAALPDAAHLHETARRRLATEALQEACLRLRRHDPAAPEDDYVELARQLAGERLDDLPVWREYRELLSVERPGTRRRLLLAGAAIRRDLDNRYRWYRWRLAGV